MRGCASKPSSILKTLVGGVLTLSLVGLAGCSSSTQVKPEPTTPAVTTTTPTPVQNPLTGQLVASEAELPDRPAITIKIPADLGARPQSGLNQADNVWVQLVEGGEIRYNAVYYSETPEYVGPVRSVRPMDGEINGPLRGVFVCSGGQNQFIEQVSGQVGKFYTESSAGPATFRTTDRKIPYNLYTSIPKVLEKIQADQVSLEKPAAQWAFAKENQEQDSLATSAEALAANQIDVKYPAWRSGWTWDAATQLWNRSDQGKETVDLDGSRITATNLVILKITTTDTGAVDPVGAPVLKSEMIGSGEAKVAIGGKIIDATWRKEAYDQPVVLSDLAGQTILLAPGRTWIESTVDSETWVTVS